MLHGLGIEKLSGGHRLEGRLLHLVDLVTQADGHALGERKPFI